MPVVREGDIVEVISQETHDKEHRTGCVWPVG